MADFFEDLGRKISDVANDIGKKTEDTIEIQKLKSDMRTLRRANDRDLMDMGRMVYDKFVQGEISDLDYVAVCESIEKRDEEMKKIAEEIQHIKGVLHHNSLLYTASPPDRFQEVRQIYHRLQTFPL